MDDCLLLGKEVKRNQGKRRNKIPFRRNINGGHSLTWLNLRPSILRHYSREGSGFRRAFSPIGLYFNVQTSSRLLRCALVLRLSLPRRDGWETAQPEAGLHKAVQNRLAVPLMLGETFAHGLEAPRLQITDVLSIRPTDNWELVKGCRYGQWMLVYFTRRVVNTKKKINVHHLLCGPAAWQFQRHGSRHDGMISRADLRREDPGLLSVRLVVGEPVHGFPSSPRIRLAELCGVSPP
ncbi:hypothetical protein BDV06DRAFT_130027 [Aspergillus oleicola]